MWSFYIWQTSFVILMLPHISYRGRVMFEWPLFQCYVAPCRLLEELVQKEREYQQVLRQTLQQRAHDIELIRIRQQPAAGQLWKAYSSWAKCCQQQGQKKWSEISYVWESVSYSSHRQKIVLQLVILLWKSHPFHSFLCTNHCWTQRVLARL